MLVNYRLFFCAEFYRSLPILEVNTSSLVFGFFVVRDSAAESYIAAWPSVS